MSRRLSNALAWLSIAGAFAPNLPGRHKRERDQLPSKYADARIAAAEAKRRRKAAKRAQAAR